MNRKKLQMKDVINGCINYEFFFFFFLSKIIMRIKLQITYTKCWFFKVIRFIGWKFSDGWALGGH